MSKSALALLVFALVGTTLHAHEADHERARAAVAAGDVLPLQQLLRELSPPLSGEVLEVELERDGGRWIYELKVLQPGGRLRKLKVDARTGRQLDRGADR